MPAPVEQRSRRLAVLSHQARKVAAKLDFLQDTIRQEGVALALVRFRAKHGERAAIVDLSSAASTLRAYAAILESSCRVIERRMKREAAKRIPPIAEADVSTELQELTPTP